jgi:hypothetical protein
VSAGYVAGAALILKEVIAKNVNPPGGLSLQALQDAGYPLSATGFRPAAAGLDEEYQIIRQSGGIAAALGIEPLQRSVGAVRTFVGFDDSGTHRSTTATGSTRVVNMNALLNWLINGTATLVGRPVLINSLGEAMPDLVDLLRDFGFQRRSKGRSSVPKAPVVRR